MKNTYLITFRKKGRKLRKEKELTAWIQGTLGDGEPCEGQANITW